MALVAVPTQREIGLYRALLRRCLALASHCGAVRSFKDWSSKIVLGGELYTRCVDSLIEEESQ